MYSAQRGKVYNFFERNFGGGSSSRIGRGREGNEEGNVLEVKIHRHSEFHEKFIGKAGREPGKRSAETSGEIVSGGEDGADVR